MLPTEPSERRRGQQLLFVAGVFGLLLTFPLLAAWDQEARVLGVPVLLVAMTALWGTLVGLTGWLVRRPAADLTPPSEAPADPTAQPTRRA